MFLSPLLRVAGGGIPPYLLPDKYVTTSYLKHSKFAERFLNVLESVATSCWGGEGMRRVANKTCPPLRVVPAPVPAPHPTRQCFRVRCYELLGGGGHAKSC